MKGVLDLSSSFKLKDIVSVISNLQFGKNIPGKKLKSDIVLCFLNLQIILSHYIFQKTVKNDCYIICYYWLLTEKQKNQTQNINQE